MTKWIALPTWIVTRMIVPTFPPEHPWRKRAFTLSDWAAHQTELCRVFDLVFWCLIPAIGVLLYRLLGVR